MPDEWLRALNQPAFHIAGAPASLAEVLGAITGLLCVWLLARQKIWTWPIGIVNNVLFVLVFWRARLYADATLQVIFAAMAAYGWWNWAGRHDAPTLPVRRGTRREWLTIAIGAALAEIALATFLARASDSPAPVSDAAILVLSLAATYGQARKILGSWWIWIAVDVISVPVYLGRQLYPTALVYACFLVLCVLGLRAWQRELSGSARG